MKHIENYIYIYISVYDTNIYLYSVWMQAIDLSACAIQVTTYGASNPDSNVFHLALCALCELRVVFSPNGVFNFVGITRFSIPVKKPSMYGSTGALEPKCRRKSSAVCLNLAPSVGSFPGQVVCKPGTNVPIDDILTSSF